ncbi:MAG TPA: antitoxin [Actinomycetales bacterium]|jgi:hypothetical protein|uniref:antitoxin n=1 Tax=uncultured Corynebacterium sp. TaxID=159447 RepID=UPI001775996F|nr:antitoxin [uncultured Corynebacterium sp.]HHU44940.1 antitoxin [Actinomycetales bacterium]
MSFIDKAKNFASKNPDKVRQAVEKVGDEIDKRTGGKYADKIDRAQEEAGKRLGGDTSADRISDQSTPDSDKISDQTDK